MGRSHERTPSSAEEAEPNPRGDGDGCIFREEGPRALVTLTMTYTPPSLFLFGFRCLWPVPGVWTSFSVFFFLNLTGAGERASERASDTVFFSVGLYGYGTGLLLRRFMPWFVKDILAKWRREMYTDWCFFTTLEICYNYICRSLWLFTAEPYQKLHGICVLIRAVVWLSVARMAWLVGEAL